jgi:hypothetical protein
MNLTPDRRDQFGTALHLAARLRALKSNQAGTAGIKEIIMRLLSLAGAFGLAIVATSQIATVADARPFAGPRYCARMTNGGENCGYYTFGQCLASVSGVGGYCIVAPMQVEVRTVITPRGPRTLVRDAID